MKLEDALDDIDKDLDVFIHNQKERIRQDRYELDKLKHHELIKETSPREQSLGLTSQGVSPGRSGGILALGDNRNARAATQRQERANDYQEFLANKRKAINGSAVGDALGRARRNTGNQLQQSPNAGTQDQNRGYDDLMQKKRLQEQQYRRKTTPAVPSGASVAVPGMATSPFSPREPDTGKLDRQRAYRLALEEQIRENETKKIREKQTSQEVISHENDDARTPSVSPRRGSNQLDVPVRQQGEQHGTQQGLKSNEVSPQIAAMPPSLPSPALFNPYFPMLYNPYVAGMLQAPTNGMLGHDMRYDPASLSSYGGAVTQNYSPMTSMQNAMPPSLHHTSNAGSSRQPVATISPRDALHSDLGYDNNVPDASPRRQDSYGTATGRLSKQQEYQRQLLLQMEEKKQAKKKEQLDKQRYEAKLEADVVTYDPWGRGGAGAPLKDRTGHLITDLRKMHQHNVEGKIVSPRNASYPQTHGNEEARTSGSFSSETALGLENSFKFDSAGRDLPSVVMDASNREKKSFKLDEHMHSGSGPAKQDDYKAFLRQQVEEKANKKKAEQEQLRLEEEKENHRVEQQRVQMQKEFEDEQERQKKKEVELRQQNEELMKLAELKRLEAEAEKKKLDETRQKELQTRAQADLQQRLHQGSRVRSPPLPAQTAKTRSVRQIQSPPVPDSLPRSSRSRNDVADDVAIEDVNHEDYLYVHDEGSSVTSLKGVTSADLDYLNSVRQSIASAHSQRQNGGHAGPPAGPLSKEDLLAKLIVLRKQLDQEERKVERELHDHKAAYDQLRTNSSKKRRGDAFEKARTRRVQGPSKALSRETPSEEFLDWDKSKDAVDTVAMRRHGGGRLDAGDDQQTLNVQQRALMREQEAQLDALRGIIARAERHFKNVSSSDGDSHPGTADSSSSRRSMLATDSKFIDVTTPPTTETTSRLTTARERRRWTKLRELAAKDELNDGESIFESGSSVSPTRTRLDLEQLTTRNEERLKMLKEAK